MLKGIDISQWQEKIDFAKVKKAGIQFAILRCGYGKTTEDPRFMEYVKGCQANGIPIHGVYSFMYAVNTIEAKQNAENAIRLVQKAGLPKSTTIWCDVEYDTVNNALKKGVHLTNKNLNEFTKIYCETVKKAGYPTGIYLNNDYRKNVYTAETLHGYDLWLADYSGDPDVPCLYQQYTSKGVVSGINGTVDMNYFFGDAKPEQKKKTADEVAQEVLKGVWGNGEDRIKRLKEAGYDPDQIQKKVNDLLKKKSITEIAKEVLEGKWGNGTVRRERLEQAGYNYSEVQKTVNQLLS